ncbi:coenzyme Q-binding protein COQ10 homolog B, mitochondrial isoform X1 [Podarcis lilfordi]|uniref:Coenzyme Q-binding protein COQ10 homolog B, mitochondrial isoform X1 n=1 Tax=Podarcis lilfordi TaxID=74358 RepID=A0AA35JNE3_9SAUR|nr:coenzyme Q-binding protein COQ10 homolog B, mitochondrial isoform X1 [Podarcis lilfordi]
MNVDKHSYEFEKRQLEKEMSFGAKPDTFDEFKHMEMNDSINVDIIDPTVHKELLRDIGNGHYSLIIDESSDASSQKQLCLMVRYFSDKLKCVVSSFVGLITFSDTDLITEALLSFLNENKLNIQKCVGIGADGLSASICGHKNSLLKKFYELNPCGVFIKCTCHFIYLCLSRAIDVLPLNLEYMVAQTYLWFSQSTFHQKRYAELYAAINVGEVALKVLQVTDTRWLSMSPCINRILSLYDTLKLHFQSVKDTEKDYSAELLYQIGDHLQLEQQWRNLDTVSWTNTEDSQIEQFWVEVVKHADEVGDKDFVELGLFALALLTLPFSSAAVECTVSQMNLIKHKLKNRPQDSLLENILRIRAYMHRNKICCNQFQPSKEMISLFSSEFYAVANSKDAIEGYDDIF